MLPSVWRAAGRVSVGYVAGLLTAMALLGPGNIWPLALVFALFFSMAAGVLGAGVVRLFGQR